MRPALQLRLPHKLYTLSALRGFRLAPPTALNKTYSAPSLRRSGFLLQLISASAILAETDNPSKRQKMGAVEGPLAGLEPANVWGFFNELTKIPRPSKHEEKCA